ncbi:hypothetical protein DAEQUDRAFT_761045 [Daedalea quercina L-15889]|uniref:Small ribosomal subunit protein mS23 n=1 Tax=Daedalea quercina L-15889 TaxID=1314783 RepID=A0A165ULB0_9APHY|nr:hypothetical protein DAEQUDRAFT_761045 [Daedalea quercina L-15889]
MAKRIAAEVHKQGSRLVRERYIPREPLWLQAVLDHPPLSLPPRDPPSRTSFDLPPHAATTTFKALAHASGHPPSQPSRIQYIEDQIRRQFFSDHPFEAFRPTTLLEGLTVEEEHPIRGKDWTRLRQRGRNPTAEDAIRFAVNLYTHHEMPISPAYATAVAQFRALRSEQHFTKRFALLEAKHYGVEFGPSQVEITFAKEEKALNTFAQNQQQRLEDSLSRKRWRAIVERRGPPPAWTKGQEYTRLWQEGVRPTYGPIQTRITAPKVVLTQEQRLRLAQEKHVKNVDAFELLPKRA